jgi:hypothetical protein
MKTLFDNLNLRPGERRLIVLVAIVTFVVLNFWFVWPHRNDWRQSVAELEASRTLLEEYETTAGELNLTSQKLSSSGASNLMADHESVHLLRTIQGLTAEHEVNVNRYEPQTESPLGTNGLFVEITLPIQFVNTRDTNLVNFLVAVSEDESLIRVRDFRVQPNRDLSGLAGRMSLVASYRAAEKKKKTTGFNAAE